MPELLRTPLFDWHAAHGGRMVEFGGWEMPVQYAGIVEEHHAVRKQAGIFDISHMGRLRFTGPDAERFLNYIVTNDVTAIRTGQVRYALVCQTLGGVLDDVLVYRLPDALWLVVNASNRLKILDWLKQHRTGFDVEIDDLTSATGMIAVQGPLSRAAMSSVDATTWDALKYYGVAQGSSYSRDGMLSRTGYTGETGFEVIVPAAATLTVWEDLLARGQSSGLKPCGLGARDTLRLEAAMPLYGHELTEKIDPITAGLEFAVKLNKPDFIGKQPLAEIAARAGHYVRVGLSLVGRRIAREEAAVFQGEKPVGIVTSGTFSPTLEQAIAMAYVVPAVASVGTSLEVDIRGRREAATVVKLPFYTRAK